MENTSKIKQYIQQIAHKPTETIRLAKIQSVHGDTCTILLDGLEIPEVGLRPVQDQASNVLRITPAVGAHAIVADLSSGTLRTLSVISVSEAQKIEISSAQSGNNTQPRSGGTQIEINGGSNGGLINIESLKSYLEALEQSISGALTAITTALATAGAPAPTIPTTFTNSMTQANQHLQTLEDPTITH
ncbi:MAG: hypothetical protein KBT04_04020 [Bacteroidales bacterium]|nr:hypothetical protein [Candidatus Colimorpha onthohippi]